MKKRKIATTIALLFMMIFLIFACKKKNDKTMDILQIDSTPYEIEYGDLPQPNIPGDNKLSNSGVQLGRMLFYEKMLSKDNSISCGSCHNQKTAFSDTNRLSKGVGGSFGKRHAMAVFNMLWNSNKFFWDGRAHLLRDQSLMPIHDNLEMGETLDNVVNKLRKSSQYSSQFIKAFGSSEITSEKISLALEQFMNSIISFNSKYDDYLAGKAILNAVEERGRFLFFTEYNPSFPEASGADCQHCHGGANFENDKYMNNGIDGNLTLNDVGREAVTNNPNDKGKFKVTSLRNIALTPPYMHDGRFKTLEQVVNHYNLVKNSNYLDPSFQQQLPNGLLLSNDDKAALVAFLKTLTDTKLTNDSKFSSPF